MRHVLTSFLTLHWAIVFALLALICIDGNRGVAAALGALGATVGGTRFIDLDNVVVVAPLATALLVVAVLFFWAFVETLINDVSNPGADVARIAFIAASGVLSLIVIGGAAQGVNGLMMAVGVQLAALLASYVAVFTERRSAVAAAAPGEGEVRAVAQSMAKAAAHSSLLSLISGRPGTQGGL